MNYSKFPILYPY